MWIVDRALARARKRSAPKKAPSRAGATLRTGPLDVRVTGRRCAPTRIASGNRRLDVLDPGARIPRSDDGICASFCDETLQIRKLWLGKLLKRSGDGIIYNDHDVGAIGPRLFEHACLLGLEGIVSKRRNSTYKAGPSRHWIKVKNPKSPAMLRAEDANW